MNVSEKYVNEIIKNLCELREFYMCLEDDVIEAIEFSIVTMKDFIELLKNTKDNDYMSGYNCGYSDAISDFSE